MKILFYDKHVKFNNPSYAVRLLNELKKYKHEIYVIVGYSHAIRGSPTNLENLININSKLWNIEDDIRECERKKLFDQTFIDLARSVYFTNDERAKVKNDINKTFGSELVEVKSYEEY